MAEKSDIQQELAQLKSDLAKLRSDVGDLAGAVKASGTDKARHVRDSLEDEINARRDELRDLIRQARAGGRRVVDDTVEGIEDTVGEHPMSSVLAAFGLGFIVAKLMANGDRR